MDLLENNPQLEWLIKNLDRSFGTYEEIEAANPLEIWLPPQAVKVIDFAKMLVWPSRANRNKVFNPPTEKVYLFNYYKGKKVIEKSGAAFSQDEYLTLYNGLVALIQRDGNRFTHTQQLGITVFNPLKYCEFKKGNLTIREDDPSTKDNSIFKILYHLNHEGQEYNCRKSLYFSTHRYDRANVTPEQLFCVKNRGICVKLHSSLGDELAKISCCKIIDGVLIEK